MKKRENEKGITLVALIVTIIVLIILAAVAVKISVDTGIVNLSKDSTEKYAAGQVEETKEMEDTYKMLESATAKIAGANGESGSGDVVQIEKAEYERMKQSIAQLEENLETLKEETERDKEYHPGDTVSCVSVTYPGNLTTVSSEIYFSVYLDKKIGSDVKEVNITSSGLQVRHPGGGYLIGNASAYSTRCQDYFKVAAFNGNVLVCKNTGNYSVTNNIPIDVSLQDFVITFK